MVRVDPDLPPPGGPTLSATAAVALGGAVGASARAGVGRLLPHSGNTWPWSTLVVNVLGSAAIALVLVTLDRRLPRARYARPLVVTGFLGGFTTYSAFAVDAVELSRHGHAGLAVGYVVVTVIGIVAACAGALVLARRLAPPPPGVGEGRR